MDGQVAALDQTSRRLRWRQQIGDDPPKKGQSVSAAPVYASGVLFAGLANGDWALRGRVVALDAKTGRELWHFFTIPGPGEPGHETWAGDNDAWKLGGGGVWLTGALDEDLGLVYFVTGNAVPQEGGGLRPGDNLYTASIIALDVQDRPALLALPGRPPRPVGRGHRRPVDPVRHAGGRSPPQGCGGLAKPMAISSCWIVRQASRCFRWRRGPFLRMRR